MEVDKEDVTADPAGQQAPVAPGGEEAAGESTAKTDEESASTSSRPRLTTTLLIFKKPSEDGDSYAIANPSKADEDGDEVMEDLEVEEEGEEEHHHKRHKKKKKKHKKSKERVLSISRAYAQKLLELQKSMLALSTKPKRDERNFGVGEVDRRRTQSLSSLPTSPPMSIKSPPPLPLRSPMRGKPSSFQGYKTKTQFSRKRQMSTCSNLDTLNNSNSKRRYTRKKRFDTDEVKSNGLLPNGEEAKKSHLSENNVWSPLDDYRLLVNIMQTKGNLEQVYAGTKFSCFYNFDQVAQRWETLLYGEKASPLAQNAIKNLHPQVKAKIQSDALFSDEEEDLLRTVKLVPGGSPELCSFTKLLDENPHVFNYRTPRKLFIHWLEMRNFHLLEGQNPLDYKDPFNLFELQDDAFLSTIPDMAVYNELQIESKQVKRQIRMLEEELESWHCMQELVVSDGTSDLHSIFSTSDFDDQTYAILRGKQVRYCMRSREILLGRHSTNNKVDADLTLEGASGKVSRRQAIIQMHGFGEFFIINQGRHPIFIDNIHVPYGAMAKLADGCVIQITHIKLIFKINEKLMRKEISRDVKKEVINARLKSYDSISSSFPSSPLRPVSGLDVFPSTSRYTSPRKRNNSVSSSPGSMSGYRGSIPNSFQTMKYGPSSTVTTGYISKLGNLGSHMLPPFTGDLTIRQSPQSPLLSPFLYDTSNKPQYSKSVSNTSPMCDNDVFKKPAPVTLLRQPLNKSSPLRAPSPATPTLPSAFVSVGLAPTPALPTSNVYTVSADSTIDTSQRNLRIPPVSTNQLMDYTKLGLSSDVTVTQMANDPSKTTPATNSASSSEKTETLSDLVKRSTENIRTPTLGLVKFDDGPSPTTSTSTPNQTS